MSSPTRNQKSSSSSSSSVHQKLSLLTSSNSKPFIKNKSQTSGSIVFPSFRFSPESEEIQEIVEGEEANRRASFSGGAAGDTSTSDRPVTPPPPSDSTPSTSTSKSGGDTSPLKEYILKHKWANKWEKRSLSLDLDLKGKIITAIEDKRRSFKSYFNEEDEAEILHDVDPLSPSIITSSCSIPEQLTTSSSLLDQDTEEISVHSDSTLLSKKKRFLLNFDEENNSDYFDEFELSPEQTSLPNTPITMLVPDDLKDLVVEEIGVDCCEDTSMVGADGKVNLSLLREFVLAPESVQERFQGLPTLYNPPSVVGKTRKFPLQEVGVPAQSPAVEEESKEPDVERQVVRPLTPNMIVKSVGSELVRHPAVKYWVGFLAIVVLFNVGAVIDRLIWFGLGVAACVIANQVLWRNEEEIQEENVIPRVIDASCNGVLTGEHLKAQGWMLTLPQLDPSTPYPPYDPFTFHLRNTKSVFIRLDGPNLVISHPHAKHRIPKRRLWNDPIVNTDMIFTRHQAYSLVGAKVEIVPTGLAKKRVWCKKYPIAITFACRDRYVGKLCEAAGNGDRSPGGGNTEKDKEEGVSFSKDEKGKESVRVGREETLRGEVYKEENVDGRTVYIFARTDREKDDWFRRLVQASKTEESSAPVISPDFSAFVSYMKRACPEIHIPLPKSSPRSSTPTNDSQETHSSASSPLSSRKSSPEKESVLLPPSEIFTPSFHNALMARIFYDFLRSPKWTSNVRQMIDRKLFFLRKPKVVQSLKVKELDLGDSLPIINHASSPVLDKQGLWVDLDISFTGNIIITIEAFLNLLNMGADMKPEPKTSSPSKSPTNSQSHAMFDSDADDSGESSESEEELELDEDAEKLKTEVDNRGKMFKYAEAISKSSVMRNKHVQKVVGNIAATPFVLTVEIKRVVGTVAVNIPPVPNDRVWIGFRSNPSIDINARPKVGERVVSLSQVTGWIKKKILLEFQRVMVCPNMADLTIGLMEFELPK